MSTLRGFRGPSQTDSINPEIAQRGPAVCYFFGKYQDCYNVNPQFCSLCGKYLCNTCRADYHRRIAGMGGEIAQKVTHGFKQAFESFL